MYAYINNNEIAFLSPSLIESELECIEYSDVSNPILIDGVIVENIPRHTRIYNAIITAENLDGFDLEGEIFTDKEKNNLITARCFADEVGGAPNEGAEKALTNKLINMLVELVIGLYGGFENLPVEAQEKITIALGKKAEVDAVRNLFNLGNL